jgi:hypothetical protein
MVCHCAHCITAAISFIEEDEFDFWIRNLGNKSTSMDRVLVRSD